MESPVLQNLRLNYQHQVIRLELMFDRIYQVQLAKKYKLMNCLTNCLICYQRFPEVQQAFNGAQPIILAYTRIINRPPESSITLAIRLRNGEIQQVKEGKAMQK